MSPLDQPNVTEEVANQSSEMPFVEHLEQLRWHIIRSGIAVLVVGVLAFVFKDFVFDTLIFGPSKESFFTYRLICKLSHASGLGDSLCFDLSNFKIINIEMSGQFLMHLQAAAVLGFVVAFPYVVWEFWGFVKPGLAKKEIEYTRGIIFFTSLLFIIGVLFGYFSFVARFLWCFFVFVGFFFFHFLFYACCF